MRYQPLTRLPFRRINSGLLRLLLVACAVTFSFAARGQARPEAKTIAPMFRVFSTMLTSNHSGASANSMMSACNCSSSDSLSASGTHSRMPGISCARMCISGMTGQQRPHQNRLPPACIHPVRMGAQIRIPGPTGVPCFATATDSHPQKTARTEWHHSQHARPGK